MIPRQDEIGGPLDTILERFEAAWAEGTPPDIDYFLREAGALRLPMLRELVQIDLERRLKNGEPARVEAYLKRYPELSREESVMPGRRCRWFRGVAGQTRRRELVWMGMAVACRSGVTGLFD